MGAEDKPEMLVGGDVGSTLLMLVYVIVAEYVECSMET